MGTNRLRYILLTAIVAASCTRTIYVPDTRTEYVTRERVDSLFLHDSIYVTEKVKGDTVYVTRYKERVRYEYVNDTDTIIRCDSIPYPVEVVRTEYRMNGFQRSFFWLGLALSALGVGYVVLKFSRP